MLNHFFSSLIKALVFQPVGMSNIVALFSVDGSFFLRVQRMGQ